MQAVVNVGDNLVSAKYLSMIFFQAETDEAEACPLGP